MDNKELATIADAIAKQLEAQKGMSRDDALKVLEGAKTAYDLDTKPKAGSGKSG